MFREVSAKSISGKIEIQLGQEPEEISQNHFMRQTSVGNQISSRTYTCKKTFSKHLKLLRELNGVLTYLEQFREEILNEKLTILELFYPKIN